MLVLEKTQGLGYSVGNARTQLRPMGLQRPPSFGTTPSAAEMGTDGGPMNLLTVAAVKLVDRQQTEHQCLAPTQMDSWKRNRGFQPRAASGRTRSQCTSARGRSFDHGGEGCVAPVSGRKHKVSDRMGSEGLGREVGVASTAEAVLEGELIKEASSLSSTASGHGPKGGGGSVLQRAPLFPRIGETHAAEDEQFGEGSEGGQLWQVPPQCRRKRVKRRGGQWGSSSGRGKLRSSAVGDSGRRRRGRTVQADAQSDGPSLPATLCSDSAQTLGNAAGVGNGGEGPDSRDGSEQCQSADNPAPMTDSARQRSSDSASSCVGGGLSATGGSAPTVVGRRTSPTGAAARVVSHLKAQRPGGFANTSEPGSPSLRASRQDFDPEESARKAAARLLAYRKSQAAARAEAEKEEAAKRRAVAEARLQANKESERRRLNIYALNAVLTKHERANILIVLEKMQAATESGDADDNDAAAELLAAVATNSV